LSEKIADTASAGLASTPDPAAEAGVAGRKLTPAVLGDQTVEGRTVADKQWEATKRRIDQQDIMISALIRVFSLLNGAVIFIVVLFWIGDFWRHDSVITEKVIMAIIGATIVQAGLAFMSITKFLFPSEARSKVKDTEEGAR
jgi:hypothetical protein